MGNFHFKILTVLWAVMISPLFLTFSFAQDNPISGLSDTYPSSQRQAAQDEIFSLGSKSIPILRQGLKQHDDSIRIECIRLLGELKAKESVEELLQYLQNSKDTRSILVTSYALGQIQDKRATSKLLRMASSHAESTVRRRAAIIALGLLKDKRVVPQLEEILTDDNELLRVFAAGSLGLLGSDKGLAVALQSTKSKKSSTSLHAIQALGLIGSKKALPNLEEIIERKPSIVKKQTIELAIFQIGLKDMQKEEKIEAIKSKILSVSKISASTRWSVNELVKIGGPGAKAALDQIVDSQIDGRLRKQAMRKRKVLNILEEMQGGQVDEE